MTVFTAPLSQCRHQLGLSRRNLQLLRSGLLLERIYLHACHNATLKQQPGISELATRIRKIYAGVRQNAPRAICLNALLPFTQYLSGALRLEQLGVGLAQPHINIGRIQFDQHLSRLNALPLYRVNRQYGASERCSDGLKHCGSNTTHQANPPFDGL